MMAMSHIQHKSFSKTFVFEHFYGGCAVQKYCKQKMLCFLQSKKQRCKNLFLHTKEQNI
jgi:hypothetical protein